jgi:MYXO-CTERM domain-containing protein
VSDAPLRLSSLDEPLERRPALQWVFAGALCLLGAALRFRDLGGESFWFDEILQIRITRQPFGEIHALVHGNWPPLGYWIQHFALLIGGENETWARVPETLWGSLTPLVVFLWMRSVFGPTAALAACALAVVSPLHIYYSQEARPYALFILLTTLSHWSLCELTMRPAARGRWWVVHGLICLLGIWTYFFMIFVFASQLAWVWALWAWRRERHLRNLALGTLATAILCGLTVLPLVTKFEEIVEVEKGSGFESLTLEIVVKHLNALSFGADTGYHAAGSFFTALPLLVLGAVWGLRRRRAFTVLLLILIAGNLAAPPLALWAVDRWFVVRYVLAALVPMLALAALGCVAVLDLVGLGVASALRRRALQPAIVATLLAVALVSGITVAARHVVTHRLHKPDWRGMAHWLAAGVSPGTPVLLPHDWTHYRLHYYLELQGATIQAEVHADADELMRRCEQLQECYVLLDSSFPYPELRAWLLGKPHAPVNLHGLQLWHFQSDGPWLHDDTPEAREATALFANASHRLDVGAEPFAALGVGWGHSERFSDQFPFRWAAATHARFHLPLEAPRGRVLAFRATTFSWDGAPPQGTTLRVNGNDVAWGVIIPGWHVYGAQVPSDTWREGVNEIEFAFDHVKAPAEISDSGDTRPLGIAVDWLQLMEGNGRPDVVEHDWTGALPPTE